MLPDFKLANLSGGHLLPGDIGPPSVDRDRPIPIYRGDAVCQQDAWRGKPDRMRVWHARALALREGKAFFSSSRGAPKDRACLRSHVIERLANNKRAV